jgi:hypothetical protein
MGIIKSYMSQYLGGWSMYSNEYWDTRYKNKGNSGRGSRGLLRFWKWRIIKRYLNINEASVIDVGCGDLAFWGEKSCNKYTGIDISPTIIEINKNKKPNWEFIVGNAETFQKMPAAEVVFCFDILFHILNDQVYKKILDNLVIYSNKYVFVYTWKTNPFEPEIEDGTYQMYRDFEKYVPLFQKSGFQLIERKDPPKYIDKYGAMWIFRKI